MKAWERNFVMAGLALTGFLFLIAAVKPTFSGGSLNATFLLFGMIIIVGAGAAWRKFASGATTTDQATPPDTSSTPPKSGPQ